jgi:hypothetical protein
MRKWLRWAFSLSQMVREVAMLPYRGARVVLTRQGLRMIPRQLPRRWRWHQGV